jgi:hypothetical protein
MTKAQQQLLSNPTVEVQYYKDEGSYFFSRLLPDGFEAKYGAENVRKFVIVEGITIIMAASHLAVLLLASPSSSSSFFGSTIGFSLLLELLVVLLLRRNHDVYGAALLLVFNINVSTIVMCLHYGVVAELYIWLGWYHAVRRLLLPAPSCE